MGSQVEPFSAMSDWVGEGNRHPADSFEGVTVPSKIIPVVFYVGSVVILHHSCAEVTPVARNGGGHSWSEVSSDTI